MKSDYHCEEKTAYIKYSTVDYIRKIEWWGSMITTDNSGSLISKKAYFHNESGPSFKAYKNGELAYVQYAVNGELHRVDGPAIICLNGQVIGDVFPNKFESYYLLGTKINKEDFETPGFIDSFILENS